MTETIDMKKTECCNDCGDGVKKGVFTGRQRVRFFHGMLLDEDTFQAEQHYHMQRMQDYARNLFGAGVVSGLELAIDGGSVVVKKGAALDPVGDLLVLDKEIRIPIEDLCEAKDPQQSTCKDRSADEDEVRSFVLCLHRNTRGGSPVAVYLPGDDCAQKACEYSRVEEGVCVSVCHCSVEGTPEPGAWDLLAKLVSGKSESEDVEAFLKSFGTNLQPGEESDCCWGPPYAKSKGTCVRLGTIKINCDGETLEDKEPTPSCDCRQTVMSPELLRILVATLLTGENGTSFAHARANPVRGICNLGELVREGGAAESEEPEEVTDSDEDPEPPAEGDALEGDATGESSELTAGQTAEATIRLEKLSTSKLDTIATKASPQRRVSKKATKKTRRRN